MLNTSHVPHNGLGKNRGDKSKTLPWPSRSSQSRQTPQCPVEGAGVLVSASASGVPGRVHGPGGMSQCKVDVQEKAKPIRS